MTNEEAIEILYKIERMTTYSSELGGLAVDMAAEALRNQPSLPSNLDEAAYEYAWEKQEHHIDYDGEEYLDYGPRYDAFKAGAEWVVAQGMNDMTQKSNNQFGYGISIVDHNNEKWVRVQTMGEDFIIAPHDLTDAKGRVMTDCIQPYLMERLAELGQTTFNRKQGFIIATLIDEINAKLEIAGGDKFEDDWYVSSELWRPVGSSADYTGNNTWYFNGINGCFFSSNRYYSYFRSRPVLAYSTQKKL